MLYCHSIHVETKFEVTMHFSHNLPLCWHNHTTLFYLAPCHVSLMFARLYYQIFLYSLIISIQSICGPSCLVCILVTKFLHQLLYVVLSCCIRVGQIFFSDLSFSAQIVFFFSDIIALHGFISHPVMFLWGVCSPLLPNMPGDTSSDKKS